MGEVYGNTTCQFNFDNETANAEAAGEGMPGNNGGAPESPDHLTAGAQQIRIFPNPAKDQLYIQLRSKDDIVAILLITDPAGRTVYSRAQQL